MFEGSWEAGCCVGLRLASKDGPGVCHEGPRPTPDVCVAYRRSVY